MSSQWPVTESFPGDGSAIRPNAPRGAGSAATPIDERGIAKSQAAQRRQTQAERPRDVAERVAPVVAVRGGVRKLANADAVENDEDDAHNAEC